MGANVETRSCNGNTKIISEPVVGTGSLSALIVLMKLGNAAHADPVEGSGASWYRIAFEKHGGRFEA
jgi:RNA-directed DNA polymerase